MNQPPLEIITIEQPDAASILKIKSAAVSFPLSADDRTLIDAMKNKLFQLGGVGLAAPQVKQNKQIIAIYIPEDAALLRNNVQTYPMHIMINPWYEVIQETETVYDFEGCYSVHNKAGKVPRYQAIQLTYQDEDGLSHTQKAEGFYARVLQHEIDHLNGILIIDRLTADCVQGSFEEMMAMRRSELSPERRLKFDQLIAKKRIKDDE